MIGIAFFPPIRGYKLPYAQTELWLSHMTFSCLSLTLSSALSFSKVLAVPSNSDPIPYPYSHCIFNTFLMSNTSRGLVQSIPQE